MTGNPSVPMATDVSPSPPKSTAVTVGPPGTGCVVMANVAVTGVSAVIVTVHGPAPGQSARCQPVKVEPGADAAVSVTGVPLGNEASQVAPQAMSPGGVGLETVPLPKPANETDNRRAAAPDCMAFIAKRLSSDDVRAVAVWLASRPVPRDARPAPNPDLPLPLECGSGLR